MRLFWNKEPENTVIPTSLNPTDTTSAPTEATDLEEDYFSVFDLVTTEDNTLEIQRLTKIAMKFARYAKWTKLKTKLALRLLPIEFVSFYILYFISLIFKLHHPLLMGLYISILGLIVLMCATAMLLIPIIPRLSTGLLQKFSELSPKKSLPILARIIGSCCPHLSYSDALEAFDIAFQKLGIEQADNVLNAVDRQNLYNGLQIKTNVMRVFPLCMNTPLDAAYSEAILSLMERHPEDSPPEELKQLSDWAPWSVVERARKIFNRVTKKSKRSIDPTKQEGFASVLYALASEDTSIQESAINQLKSITPKKVSALLEVLGTSDKIAFQKLWILLVFLSGLVWACILSLGSTLTSEFMIKDLSLRQLESIYLTHLYIPAVVISGVVYTGFCKIGLGCGV